MCRSPVDRDSFGPADRRSDHSSLQASPLGFADDVVRWDPCRPIRWANSALLKYRTVTWAPYEGRWRADSYA